MMRHFGASSFRLAGNVNYSNCSKTSDLLITNLCNQTHASIRIRWVIKWNYFRGRFSWADVNDNDSDVSGRSQANWKVFTISIHFHQKMNYIALHLMHEFIFKLTCFIFLPEHAFHPHKFIHRIDGNWHELVWFWHSVD